MGTAVEQGPAGCSRARGALAYPFRGAAGKLVDSYRPSLLDTTLPVLGVIRTVCVVMEVFSRSSVLCVL